MSIVLFCTPTLSLCRFFVEFVLKESIMKRIGVVGIVVEDRHVVLGVQEVLSSFNHIIIGRMGVPDRESGINAISIIVKGTVEEISALTGKLGRLGVAVKSALTTVDVE